MRSPANLLYRVIALLAIVVGLLLIAIPAWLFRDTTDATRKILVDSGMAVVLLGVGAIGVAIIQLGIPLLFPSKKRHPGSSGANEEKADK
jgi:hypothetical protein